MISRLTGLDFKIKSRMTAMTTAVNKMVANVPIAAIVLFGWTYCIHSNAIPTIAKNTPTMACFFLLLMVCTMDMPIAVRKMLMRICAATNQPKMGWRIKSPIIRLKRIKNLSFDPISIFSDVSPGNILYHLFFYAVSIFLIYYN